MADGFRIATAFVSVSPDTTGFREELKEQLDEAVAGVSAKARVDLDTSELDAKVDEAKARVDELDGARAEPSVHLNDEELSAGAEEAHEKLDELDSRSARPDVGLDAGDLDARIDEARTKLDELDERMSSPKLGLDTEDFDTKLAEAQAKLEAFKSESANASLGATGGGGGESGGSSEGGLAGMLAMGVGSLLPGVGGAAAGLGLMGGAGALAFGGISKALSAAHQASLNVGMTGQQAAATQFSNQVAVQQAQNSVGQAHMQAAQDAVTSAAQIEQSQMNLASTERNAAESQVQALQSVVQAQQGVEEANYSLSEAQYNLTQAWETAREQIAQLNDALSDSKLNVQQAQLAIQQAEYQQRLTDQNAYSTQLDREQAALAVAQAQQQLKDAQDQLTASQYKANLANQQGVAGSQEVIQAKQGVTQAQYGQIDAQQQYADAQKQLTLTELNNQEQIKQAQMQLTAAQEQAAYQQQVDARNTAIAEQNVANTIREQQLQWAATMSTENEAALQFQKDMSRLSPAARDVVNQILGMKGAFKDLATTAQDAVAPGVSVFLSGLSKSMPTVTAGVGKMASAIGSAFGDIGKALASKSGQNVLSGLISNGLEFVQIVMPAFGHFAGMLADIGSKKGAVDGLANLLGGFARGLTGLAQSVGANEKPINAFLTAVGNVIAQIGPPLGQMIGLVAKALGPLTNYLNQHPNGTLAKVLGGIVAGMLAIKGLGKILPDFITKPLEEAAGKLGKNLFLTPLKSLGSQIAGSFKGIFSAGGMFDGLRLQAMYAIENVGQAFKTGGSAVASALRGWGSSFASVAKGWGSSLASGARGLGSSVATAVKGWSGSLASAVKNVMPTSLDVKLLAQSAKDAGAQVAGKLMSGLSQVQGFFTSTLPQALSAGGQAVKGFASNAVTVVSGWASSVGQAAASAGSSIASFVVSMGSKLAAAASATGAWIAENTVAVGSYIAENIAAAASATAAFIAENAASLGLIAGIGLVIAAIVLLATHWKDVWHGIEVAALWLWHNVLDPMWHGIEEGASWLYNNGIKYYFDLIKMEFSIMETVAMWLWHEVFDPLWHGIEAGASAFVGAFKAVWGGLQTVFKTPVNFLIGKVYDDGIAGLWNATVSALGMKSLKLPIIPQLAGGGVLSGYSPGHDTVPAMLSPGEGVLVPEAVRAIGPGTVHALNHQYGGGRTSKGGHFSGGGIVGDIWHDITGAASKAYDIGKITAAIATGNSTALTNALTSLVSTKGAVGNYAKMMLGVPTTLIHDAVTSLMNLFGAGSSPGGGGSGGSTSVKGNGSAANGVAAAAQAYAQSQLSKFGWASSQMQPLIYLWNQESGWNPNAVNPSSGAYGIPQALGHGHPYNLGDYVSQINWGLQYIQGRYGSPSAAWAHEVANNWYDDGGIATGIGMLPKNTPKPERVLNPEQTDNFERLVAILGQMFGPGATAPSSTGRQVTVNQYYTGTQIPTAEQSAWIRRDLSMALSGA